MSKRIEARPVSRGHKIFRVVGFGIFVASAFFAAFGTFTLGAQLFDSLMGALALGLVGALMASGEAFGFALARDEGEGASRKALFAMTIICILGTNGAQLFNAGTWSVNDVDRARIAEARKDALDTKVANQLDPESEREALGRAEARAIRARELFDDFASKQDAVLANCTPNAFCADAKPLQVLLGANPDGIIGPRTSAAAAERRDDLEESLDAAEASLREATERYNDFVDVIRGDALVETQEAASRALTANSLTLTVLKVPGIRVEGDREASYGRATIVILALATLLFSIMSIMSFTLNSAERLGAAEDGQSGPTPRPMRRLPPPSGPRAPSGGAYVTPPPAIDVDGILADLEIDHEDIVPESHSERVAEEARKRVSAIEKQLHSEAGRLNDARAAERIKREAEAQILDYESKLAKVKRAADEAEEKAAKNDFATAPPDPRPLPEHPAPPVHPNIGGRAEDWRGAAPVSPPPPRFDSSAPISRPGDVEPLDSAPKRTGPGDTADGARRAIQALRRRARKG